MVNLEDINKWYDRSSKELQKIEDAAEKLGCSKEDIVRRVDLIEQAEFEVASFIMLSAQLPPLVEGSAED